jgi:hypothetical protein
MIMYKLTPWCLLKTLYLCDIIIVHFQASKTIQSHKVTLICAECCLLSFITLSNFMSAHYLKL